MGRDGILSVRLVPSPAGDAAYGTISGELAWGIEKYDSDFTGTLQGDLSYGILREDTEAFPSGHQYGVPKTLHPDANNTKVEIVRLGKKLKDYAFELPRNYVKYVIFYAMSQALKREGPGQDIKLAKHYAERFELGILRMDKRMQKLQKQLVRHLGQRETEPQSLGDPSAGWQYSIPGTSVRGGY
jgi:hypothetical protein